MKKKGNLTSLLIQWNKVKYQEDILRLIFPSQEDGGARFSLKYFNFTNT